MTEDTRKDSRSGKFWAWVPVGLLGAMFTGLGTLAYIAVNDPGFALEPNYYDKAVHWDRSRAEERASRELGLQLSLTRRLLVGPGGQVELELLVRDKAGAPFSGAEVKVEAFPNAFASRVEHWQLREVAPGTFRASLEHGTPGLWELRFAVTRGADRFRQILREDVAKGGAA